MPPTEPPPDESRTGGPPPDDSATGPAPDEDPRYRGPVPPEGPDRPPSRRFTILFTIAMVLIAVGYMWVWHAKTSRVVAEPPPDFVLGTITSRVPGHGPADEAALRDSLAARLRSVPRLSLFDSMSEIQPSEPVPGRLPTPAYRLVGALDRDDGGQFSLEVRRVDARTDSLLYIYRVRASTLREVVYRMTVQVAMSYGLPIPARPAPASPAREAADIETDTH